MQLGTLLKAFIAYETDDKVNLYSTNLMRVLYMNTKSQLL